MTDLKHLILEILNEIEKKDSNVNVAGGKGYGTGKIYPDKTVGVLKMLGHEEGEEQEEYKLKPVKISKAFKRRRKNDQRSRKWKQNKKIC